jgi:regulator of replication initiation timing
MEYTARISQLRQEIEELTAHCKKTLDENNRAHFEREISVKRSLIKAYEEKDGK